MPAMLETSQSLQGEGVSPRVGGVPGRGPWGGGPWKESGQFGFQGYQAIV